MRRGKDGGSEESVVIPLLLQNKPPVVPGKEEDELADVDLRPDQVKGGVVWWRSGVGYLGNKSIYLLCAHLHPYTCTC